MTNDPNIIIKELYRQRWIDLSGYKTELFQKAIQARMSTLNIYAPSAYVEQLRNNPSECDYLLESLLITVSSFFRNPIVFEIIAQQVLPQIIENKQRIGSRQIRVWSAGCAAGEEPYSIAILIQEALRHKEFSWTPFIFATDISENALKRATTGKYERDSLENTKLGIIDKYFFTSGNNIYQLSPMIRNMVSFSFDNLASEYRFAPAESVFGAFDLILCRNVIIYFSPELQKKISDKFYKALDKRGFLVLGDCEYLHPTIARKMITIDSRNRIFQKP